MDPEIKLPFLKGHCMFSELYELYKKIFLKKTVWFPSILSLVLLLKSYDFITDFITIMNLIILVFLKHGFLELCFLLVLYVLWVMVCMPFNPL